ncbi:hypothetical protein EVAR_32880_1 [Eumeta japonica]|uniref:Uncharacterized protein n=1 Tax=Eumeta variegata TaxID=151549 RepID=A0A4C1VS84_EUMVA|nr:hypothetical protein EVAR_32880_1 [Eumeta japonica]
MGAATSLVEQITTRNERNRLPAAADTTRIGVINADVACLVQRGAIRARQTQTGRALKRYEPFDAPRTRPVTCGQSDGKYLLSRNRWRTRLIRNYSVLSRFDGPGCGSASDRVSELNTSGRTGEGRVLMLAVHHQSHFHLLIEASKIDLLQMQRKLWSDVDAEKQEWNVLQYASIVLERLAAT